MVSLPLMGRWGQGKFTLVDDDLLPELSIWRWRVTKNGYVEASHRNGPGRLAHVVLGVRGTCKNPVDHINGDKLDNRRQNLRRVPARFNLINRSVRRDNKSGFTNVYRSKSGRYVAIISRGVRQKRLGTFDTAQEAALAVAKYNQSKGITVCHE